MAKEKFRDVKLNKNNLLKLEVINNIIEEYAADGYKMTLRQLYYQLVSRDIIPNQQKEYAKLSNLLKEGRMAGIVDWEAIEDRLRVPKLPYYVLDKQDALSDTILGYRLDRQSYQDTYLEVWVEKDALSGVLSRITNKYHVRLLVSRGYNSVTAIHDAYERFSRRLKLGKTCKILYLGDHDPSGMDMIRDVQERVNEMLEVDFDSGIEVEPIALTTQQVKEYEPPRNPAKLTDPRAKWYIEEYGYSSWEVDALDPKTLNSLLENTILENIDIEKYERMMSIEESDKEELRELSKKL